jgi:Domain of unknown function (DUF4123)
MRYRSCRITFAFLAFWARLSQGQPLLPSETVYYAVDAPEVTVLVDHVVAEISKALAPANGDVIACALLDSAFDYGGKPLALSLPVERLYSQGRWERLSEVSPALVELPVGRAEDLRQAIGHLARHCSARPMLSFVASRLKLVELARSWRECVAPKVAGIESPLLRFADTRVAAMLPTSLEPANWQRLSSPVNHWWIVDRTGLVAELSVAAAPPDFGLTSDQVLELSEVEVNRLVQASMPDTLVQTMIDQLPELVPNDGRFQFYSLMREVVGVAEKNGVDSYPDIYALAVYAATGGDISLTNQALIEVLRAKDWKTSELSMRLVELV